MAAQQFSIAAAISGMATNTFRSARSYEREEAARLERLLGTPRGDPNYGCRIPASALLPASASRGLTAGTGANGGYLVDDRNLGYAPALQPRSVVLKAGALVVPVRGGAVFVPKGSSGVTTYWLANEAATATESQPLFGMIQPAPKMLAAYCEVSRQLLLQSNAEEVLRQELAGAAAAALDAAVLNGSGASGQPAGIISTAGIGGVTGTSLAFAGITEFQQDVALANAGHDPGTCAYVTTPAVSGILKQRQRFSSNDTPIWEGPLTHGKVDGIDAYATTGMPASNLLYGDFSAVTVVIWDDLAIELNPFTKMPQSIVGVRLLLPMDVVVRYASAFSLATAVT